MSAKRLPPFSLRLSADEHGRMKLAKLLRIGLPYVSVGKSLIYIVFGGPRGHFSNPEALVEALEEMEQVLTQKAREP